MAEIRPGIYEHYKGKRYEVVGVARHSETEERLVVYRALYEHPTLGYGSFWVRPESMFAEDVLLDGRPVPRFRFVGADER